MGIEPTRHRFGRLTGFEDRGGHQTNKRFRDSSAEENRDEPLPRMLSVMPPRRNLFPPASSAEFEVRRLEAVRVEQIGDCYTVATETDNASEFKANAFPNKPTGAGPRPV